MAGRVAAALRKVDGAAFRDHRKAALRLIRASRFFALAGLLANPVNRLKSAALTSIGERRFACFSFVFSSPTWVLLTL
jgi:hypothetical protein